MANIKYWKTFPIFLKYTNEKEVAVENIIKIIKPKTTWSFLDVGCGTGDITIPIARVVDSTTAIDNNRYLLDIARKKAKGIKKIRFIYVDWNKTSNLGSYDLVLASHILQLKNFKNKVEKAIDKLILHVKNDGYLVIVAHSKNDDYYKIINRFWKSIKKTEINEGLRKYDYKFIAGYLTKIGYKVKTKKLISESKLPLGEMSFVQFFFGTSYEKVNQKMQKEIQVYISKLVKNKKVIIKHNPYLIIIKK